MSTRSSARRSPSRYRTGYRYRTCRQQFPSAADCTTAATAASCPFSGPSLPSQKLLCGRDYLISPLLIWCALQLFVNRIQPADRQRAARRARRGYCCVYIAHSICQLLQSPSRGANSIQFRAQRYTATGKFAPRPVEAVYASLYVSVVAGSAQRLASSPRGRCRLSRRELLLFRRRSCTAQHSSPGSQCPFTVLGHVT